MVNEKGTCKKVSKEFNRQSSKSLKFNRQPSKKAAQYYPIFAAYREQLEIFEDISTSKPVSLQISIYIFTLWSNLVIFALTDRKFTHSAQ